MSYYSRHHSSSTPLSFYGICILIIIILWIIETAISTANYNNGACSVCGGTLEYQQAVGHRIGTDYVYKCDKCGRLVTTNEYFQPTEE